MHSVLGPQWRGGLLYKVQSSPGQRFAERQAGSVLAPISYVIMYCMVTILLLFSVNFHETLHFALPKTKTKFMKLSISDDHALVFNCLIVSLLLLLLLFFYFIIIIIIIIIIIMILLSWWIRNWLCVCV